MKKIEFNSIVLENFGKHKHLEIDFKPRTRILGQNGVGKSTVATAIAYALGCKADDGKEISGIRPHDKDGVDRDDLKTVVELEVVVDGEPVKLKKEYYLRVNRKGESSGNTTDYYIEGVKKKKAEYESFVGEILPSEVCINAREFLALDMPKRRDLLERQFREYSDDEILSAAQFEPIVKLLKYGTVAEQLKSCRKAMKDLEKERDTIPARIEELEMTKVDADFAEMELQKNALNEQIAENQKKQFDTAKQFEEYDKLADGIMELKFKLSDMQNKANAQLADKWRKLNIEKQKLQYQISDIDRTIEDNRKCVDINKETAEYSEKDRIALAEKWKKIKSEHFDESRSFCPTCNQHLPAEECKRLSEEFESNKEERLRCLEEDGQEAKQRINHANEQILELEKMTDKLKAEKSDLEKQVFEIESKLSKQPQVADLSKNEEYKNIQIQISEKEKAVKDGNFATAIRQVLKDEEADLRQQLTEVESQLALSHKNIEIDERIEKLQAKKLELSQKIANEQRTGDLLRKFEYKKNELLEESVNAHFKYVQFRMFEKQVNGDLKQVCNPVIDGESYDRRLNTGFKALAEIDICLAFQRAYGIVAPLIVDNAECIDRWRLPDIENQMILIERTDDRELAVEVE